MPPLNVTFAGGSAGRWSIERLDTVAGSPLAPACRLEVIEGLRPARPAGDAVWVLRGVTSNERYATAREHREHVTFVEKVWFDEAVTGRSRAEIGIPAASDESFILHDGDTIASVQQAHREAWESSRCATSSLGARSR